MSIVASTRDLVSQTSNIVFKRQSETYRRKQITGKDDQETLYRVTENRSEPMERFERDGEIILVADILVGRLSGRQELLQKFMLKCNEHKYKAVN